MAYNLQSQKLIDAVASVAMQTGIFEKVNQHEPKGAAPGGGLIAAAWMQNIGPSNKISGLSNTAAKVTMMLRIYAPGMSNPPDMIEPTVMNAVDVLIGTFSGEFTLNGLVFSVDLLGMDGPGLGGKAGYVEISGKIYRVFDVSLTLLVDAVWSQTP